MPLGFLLFRTILLAALGTAVRICTVETFLTLCRAYQTSSKNKPTLYQHKEPVNPLPSDIRKCGKVSAARLHTGKQPGTGHTPRKLPRRAEQSPVSSHACNYASSRIISNTAAVVNIIFVFFVEFFE